MSIIEMVVRSKSLHADTLFAAAMRHACGLDGIEAYEAKRNRFRHHEVDRADYERVMSQRYGALDRVR